MFKPVQVSITRILCVFAALASLAGAAEKENWQPLFDGKTLDGWTQRGGKAKYSVEDGVIVGETVPGTPNSFLCTNKNYANFILELEFKVTGGMNSGIQIRSQSIPEYHNGQVHGYQIEIDPSSRAWSGGLYEEGRRLWLYNLTQNKAAGKAYKQTDWNKYRIEAIGDTIKTWVNGVPATDYRETSTVAEYRAWLEKKDPKNTYKEFNTTSGFIALQVHASKSEKPLQVRFRNIRIQDLGADKSATTGEKKAPIGTPSPDADVYFGDWEEKPAGGSAGMVAQVIALGSGKYKANLLKKFDTNDAPLAVLNGQEKDGKLTFAADAASGWSGEIAAGDFKASGKDANGKAVTFEMKHLIRQSPTMGQKPPAGALILFDASNMVVGTNMDQWETEKGQPCPWKLADGVMEVAPGKGSIVTKKKLSDFQLHAEFRLPFQPDKTGQGRGNSGFYIMNRYEVQVLDSYGLVPKDQDCGALYKIVTPSINMCYPPLTWQTYDITFHAPKFDVAGKKTHKARFTIVLNGVKVQDNVEIDSATGAAKSKGELKEPAALLLQDHGNPVQYRNMWLKEIKD
ncbi:MAG: DUF1080 domain-containing protein [Candidatus Sumerlaeota bacterium]|nr:DUF1080 domain-containing protein [Candidatus Sumerlaeota bacterium]